MFDSKEKLFMAINKCLPYADQITSLDFTSEINAIRFVWRGNHFRISTNGEVEEVGNGVLIGSDICIILRALLNR